jgi:hypothetical protein
VVGNRSWQQELAKASFGKRGVWEKFLVLKVFQKKILNIQKGWLLEFF